MFSRVWKPDETLALVFEIVLTYLVGLLANNLKLLKMKIVFTLFPFVLEPREKTENK